MLLQLSIHHLALINDMTIDFEPGMNVMTGETGAGKSIVVDAVNLVLGERADRDLITNGEMKARVEAVFDIADNEKVKGAAGRTDADRRRGYRVHLPRADQRGAKHLPD